jgi:hypothetical protein
VCALHPIYINIPALGDLPKDILTEVAAKQKELDLEKLDYEVLICFIRITSPGRVVVTFSSRSCSAFRPCSRPRPAC